MVIQCLQTASIANETKNSLPQSMNFQNTFYSGGLKPNKNPYQIWWGDIKQLWKFGDRKALDK
jgi:hypothetical protein